MIFGKCSLCYVSLLLGTQEQLPLVLRAESSLFPGCRQHLPCVTAVAHPPALLSSSRLPLRLLLCVHGWSPDSACILVSFLGRVTALLWLMVNSKAHSRTSVLSGRDQTFQVPHRDTGPTIPETPAPPAPSRLLLCPRCESGSQYTGQLLPLHVGPKATTQGSVIGTRWPLLHGALGRVRTGSRPLLPVLDHLSSTNALMHLYFSIQLLSHLRRKFL